MRGVLIVSAAVFAVLGWRLLDRSWLNFDAALRWYGAAILLLVAAALPWPSFGIPGPARIREFLVRHRWELAAFALVLGLGVFMRVYEFGHFPPGEGTAYEEAQTGGHAYRVLNEGQRPVEFAITNYTAALGFVTFGYDTMGLRLPFLLAGILSVPAFFMLLRFLVSAPTALFVTGLFAVNRWHAFTSGIADETFLGASLAIVAVLLLIVVLRSGGGLAVVALALVTGAINYEYSAYRQVPFLLVGVLAAYLAYRVAKEAIAGRSFVAAFASAVNGKWWLPPIFVIALFISVSPLVIASLHGNRFYFEQIERNKAGTTETDLFGLLPENWETKLKWTTEVFLPVGPRPYPHVLPLDLPGERMLDPVTGGLAVVAMAYALATLHRPYRLFFALWLFAGLFVGGVLPIYFNVAKFTGLLPPLFVLIAFFVDDALRFVQPRLPRFVAYGVLVPVVGCALFVNVDVLSRQADDKVARAEFSSHGVNLCSFAKDLGSNTYVYFWSEIFPTHGLLTPGGDFDWICHDIAGEPLNSPGAVRHAELPSQSEIAFIYLTMSQEGADPAEHLRQSYPQFTLPTQVRQPFEAYTLRAFVAPTGELAQQRGLYVTYDGAVRPSTSASITRVEPAELLINGGNILWPNDAEEMRWEGLVLLRRAGQVALSPSKALPLEVLVDGRQVHASTEGHASTPIPLDAGWHTVRMTLSRTAGDSFPGLAWVNSSGDLHAALLESDFFALTPATGWTHAIIAQVGEQPVSWQQIEEYPVLGFEVVRLPNWLTEELKWPRGTLGAPTEEKWSAHWKVSASGSYRLNLTVGSGVATLMLDGAPFLKAEAATQLTAVQGRDVVLNAGEHPVEIVFERNGVEDVGVALEIESATGEGHFEPY